MREVTIKLVDTEDGGLQLYFPHYILLDDKLTGAEEIARKMIESLYKNAENQPQRRK